MPNNKSHHFVPKFYLKNFASSDGGKSISLFNLNRHQFIQNAPVKTQCCRDYLYGKEGGAEQGLAGIEGMVAALFRRMNCERRLPRPFTAAHLVLCLYIVLQHSRTQYAADALNDMVDGFTREVFRGHPDIAAEDLEKVRFGYDHPALMSTSVALQFFPMLMDLRMGALISPPECEFLTSDNPVVLHNQFMNWRGRSGGSGLGAKGLQIFFPIWPRLTVVFYDKDVYHFGETKESTVALATPQDVHELNVMQAVSAAENLYMFSSLANVYVVANHAQRFRREVKVTTTTYEQESSPDRRRAIIASSREAVRTDAALNFMKLPKRSKRWLEQFKNLRMQPAVVARNPELMSKFESHMKAVDSGTARSEDAIQDIYGVTIEDDTF